MSYDLMVFDKKKRFRAKDDFFTWYNKLIEWSDNIDYNDYRHSTNELQNFFLDMKDIVPPLNGEFSPSDEELGQGVVTLVDLFGHGTAGISEGQISCGIHQQISGVLQKAHRSGDAGLAEAHVLRHVQGTHMFQLLGKNEDGFQIHLSGFLQAHPIASSHLLL